MRRFSLWLHAHPMVGDSVLAAFVGLFSLPFVFGNAGTFLAAGLLVLPLIIRRKRPVLSAYLIMAGGYLDLLATAAVTLSSHSATMPSFTNVAIGISLYTLAVTATRRTTLIYSLLCVLGSVLWPLTHVLTAHPNGESLLVTMVVSFLYVMCFAVFYVTGEFVAARRAYHGEAERRLRMLETERNQQARIAVAEERARIARELHDVVAHSVSVMVVQSDGAVYALKTKPELAEEALKTISDTGRQALAELRRLLGVLRNDEDAASSFTPQPDASGLAELAEKMREVGLSVTLEIEGELTGLPTGVGLSAYRIIQEALTNTLKYAGREAHCTVRVRRTAERLEIAVLDNGGQGMATAGVSGGNGLIGMRERASVYGGTLEAGPRPGGGWRVRAVLPVNSDTPG